MEEQKIQFLSEIDHIKARPSLYIGTTETPKTLIKELVDNSLDEVLNGYSSRLDVEMDTNQGRYIVRDDGRGLPLYKVEQFDNQIAAKLLFTKLFSSGKFHKDNYTYSCLTGDCKVFVLDNSSWHRIDEIANTPDKYQWTLTLNTSNGEWEAEKITNPHVTGYVRELLKISFKEGGEITCTPEHKFLTKDGIYVEAKDLYVTTSSVSMYKTIFPEMAYSNDHIGITVEKIGEIYLETEVPVYDFTTLKNHNYIVKCGEDHGVVVHNSGTHGIGCTAVCALSSEVLIKVNSKAHKKHYTLLLRNGEVVCEKFDAYIPSLWWTTEVQCVPNKDYFKSVKCTLDLLPLQVVKEMFPDSSIKVNSEEIFSFSFKSLFDIPIIGDHVFSCVYKDGSLIFEVFFGWSTLENNLQTRGLVNLVSTSGWNEKKALLCLGKALCEATDQLTCSEDAQYGLRIFVNTFCSDPYFTSQTKERLSYIKNEPIDLDKKFTSALKDILLKNEEITETVISKIITHKKALQKLTDSELINSIVRTGNDKRKGRGVGVGVWDCSTTKREDAELYLCEGASASGGIRQTRNLQTQAVLPLRGKVLNVAVSDDLKEILENKEMLSIINCIGVGITPKVDLSAMRYGKILIACDADSDGASICNLIIGALVYLIPEVVYAGKVYEILAPLYEQEGNYFYQLSDLNTRKHFERFKGLGSMDPGEVEVTIVNPKTRRLRQVTLGDDRERILSIMQSSYEKKRIMIQYGIVIE